MPSLTTKITITILLDTAQTINSKVESISSEEAARGAVDAVAGFIESVISSGDLSYEVHYEVDYEVN